MAEPTSTIDREIASRIAELEATLAVQQAALDAEHAALEVERARRVEAEAERDRLREAYQQLVYEVELARRRIVVAKAERIDTTQLEIEFADKLAELDKLAGWTRERDEDKGAPKGDAPKRKRGRRKLRVLAIHEERIVVPDPTKEGKHERIGFEESSTLRYQRGGMVCVTKARVKYADEKEDQAAPAPAAPRQGDDPPADLDHADDKEDRAAPESAAPREVDDVPADCTHADENEDHAPPVSVGPSKVDDVPAQRAPIKTYILPVPPEVSARATADLKPGSIYTTPLPPELLPRSIASPSLVAHIAVDKFCDGLPLHRQEDRFARMGAPIDRGSMCRWLEEVGTMLGVTVVEAMRREALATAFCIATDATGILVQPIRGGDKKRQSCRRAHYFVQIADADHVFFEYTPHETSAAVGEMFRGFSGYVQADAKSVYDFLYRRAGERSPPDDDMLDDGKTRVEVGCWSHLRTKLWEAAVTTKEPVAREGLARIMRMFQLERTWKKKGAAERKALRDLHLRVHVEKFFEFARDEWERVKDRRGYVRTAFGYAVRQEHALVRFLDDGRLPMTNNHSERELRRVATGRKAWLFVGSDDHGQAAGHWLTLIASARMHGLDPEQYMRDMLCVLAQWPRDRYLELAPKYWRATRARLDDAQLEIEIGWYKIPEPPLPTDLARVLAAAAPAPATP